MKKNEKKLYPFIFDETVIERPWGREVWTVADMTFVDSVVSDGYLKGNSLSDLMETYLERMTGEKIYDFYGRQFPLMVKFVDVKGRSPLMVHPSDEIAVERYDALGKAELWYVLSAEDDARVSVGFENDITPSEFFERFREGKLEKVLHTFVPHKGDIISIPPGYVHSASGHMKLAAVMESSDLDFILLDHYDAPSDKEASENRQTALSEAFDFINYGKSDVKPLDASSFSCPEFNVNVINLAEPLKVRTDKFGGFVIYICTEGEVSVQVMSTRSETQERMTETVVGCGNAVMVPADVQEVFLVPRDRNTVLVEAVPHLVEMPDSYINPDTEPFLEGEDYEGLEDGLDEDGLDADSEEDFE